MTDRLSLESLFDDGLEALLNPAPARRAAGKRLSEEVAARLRGRPDEATRKEWAERLENDSWCALQDERGGRWDLGWAELVAGFAVAIELLRGELPSSIRDEIRDTPAEERWREQRRPYQRFALLIGAKAEARRVFVAPGDRLAGKLVEDSVRWGHDGPSFSGRSHTLLLGLLADELLPSDADAIAASGVLLADGRTVGSVDGMVEKAEAWWQREPTGLLITAPVCDASAADWAALARLEQSAGCPRGWVVGRTLAEIGEKVARLDAAGSPVGSGGAAAEVAAKFAVELQLRAANGAPSGGPSDDPLLDAAWAAHTAGLTGAGERGVLIRGMAGSGKTTFTRVLERRFLSGPLGALGFGVRRSARDLAGHLHCVPSPTWSGILSSAQPDLQPLFEELERTGRLVPIIDGLDELDGADLQRFADLLRSVPGWWLGTARPGPHTADAVAPASVLDVQELAPGDAERFWAGAGRGDLCTALTSGELPADLVQTPLLATAAARSVLPGEQLADVPRHTRFRRALDALLVHARDAGRLTDRQTALLQRMGESAFGEIAFAWRRSSLDALDDSNVRGLLEGAGFTAGERAELLGAVDRLGCLLIRTPEGWSFDNDTLAQWAAESAASRRETSETPYRLALADYCRSVAIVGFPDSGHSDHRGDLFLPPRLWSLDGQESTFDSFVTRLKRQPVTAVIFAEPGGGKTTLARQLVRRLALLPRGPLPLLVSLRRISDHGKGLSGWLAEQPIPVAGPVAEQALGEGRAVLVLDGLDELGSAPRRVEVRDQIAGLRRRWPGISVVVLSRPQGFHHNELDDFEVWHVADLTDELRAGLLARWCSLLHPRDALAAAEAQQEIVGVITSAPRVDALARSPLIVTMLVLAWRADGELPRSRSSLFERCIEMMLFTWPEARGGRFDGIAPDVQLASLQRIAWQMHADSDGFFLNVPRRRLVEMAADALRSVAAKDVSRQLASEWVDHLVEGSGLLDEPTPGRFDFVHRALAESLAAEGLWQLHGADSARLVAERARTAEREIYRLLFERRAADREFAAKLLDAAETTLHRGHGAHGSGGDESNSHDLCHAMELLLEALREGVEWSETQREAVYGVLARAQRLIHAGIDEKRWDLNAERGASWNETSPIRELLTSARSRHPDVAGQWTRWLRQRLDAARGDALLDAVVWAVTMEPEVEPLDLLRARRDTSAAADDCFSFWPAGSLGHRVIREEGGQSGSLVVRGVEIRRWVGAEVSAERALDWLADIPDAAIFELALAALLSGAGTALAGALAVRMAENALRLGSVTPEGVARMLAAARERAAGSRDYIKPTSGAPMVMVYPRRPPYAPGCPGVPGEPSWTLSELVRCLDVDTDRWRGALGLIGPQPAAAPERIHASGPLHVGPDRLDEFTASVDRSHSLGLESARSLAFCLADSVTVEDLRQNECPLNPTAASISRRRGVTESPLTRARDYKRILRWFDRQGLGPLRAYRQLEATYLAEVLVSAFDGWGLDEVDRLGAFRHRMRNRLALEVWPLIEEMTLVGCDDRDSPGLAALYFALAWSQHTTTGNWPDTRMWAVYYRDGGVPQHWLPRAHWHLVWLAHDATDSHHREGFEVALAEGLGDVNLCALARAMSNWRPA